MRVRTALDHLEPWAALTGRTSTPEASSLGRWVAIGDRGAVAGIEARLRPDGRVFLSVHGTDRDAHALLIEHARASLGRPLHVTFRKDRPPGRQVLIDTGFRTTLIEDLFIVDFAAALEAVSRAWIPSGHSIVSAAAVDADRLFELDNRLRRLVAGTEDWKGDRGMFDAELAESPPFDADGYLVGRDERSGELTGLIRFWRNPSGPRLGMIGVVPELRGTTLGPALLTRGLEAASSWGSTDFVTETTRSNGHVHHRLIAIGASVTGSIEIMTG